MYAGFVLSLFVTSCLFAQYIWGDPIIIASHPTAQITDQNMFIDRNGTIHVVWNEVYETNLSQIYYSKSNDIGTTWSTPYNVSQSDASKLARPAVGADYNGNVFVSYTWNSLGYPILLQKKFDGVTWSEPARLDSNSYQFGNWYLNDHEGRTYQFWHQLAQAKYRYKEKDSTEWTDFNYSIYDYFISDIKVDESNNLHAVGSKTYVLGEDTRAMYIRYDRPTDSWIDYNELDINYSQAEKICISHDNYIHTVFSERDYNQTHFIPYYKKKSLIDSLWSEPELMNESLINESSSPMIVFMNSDSDNNPHIFMYLSSAWGIAHEYIRNNIGIWSYNMYYSPNTSNNIKQLDENNLCILHLTEDELKGDNLYFIKTTGVGIEDQEIITSEYYLYQNYPNPFNNETIITFSINEANPVELNLFNTKGELVKNLISNRLNKGKHKYTLKSENINSGVYYYRLSVGGILKETKRMLYVK